MALHHEKISGKSKKYLLAVMVSVGMFGGVSANAGLMDALMGFVQNFIGKGFDTKDSNVITDNLVISSSQTGIAPNEIHEMMDAASKAYMVAERSTKDAYRIKQLSDDMTFVSNTGIDPKTGEKVPSLVGSGLSSDLNCEALAEKVLTQTKGEMRDAETYNAHRRMAQLYSTSPKEKQANRVLRHLDEYCDVSEVAGGVCTFSMDKGSADSSYYYLYSKDALADEDVDAALSYTLNVIDPVNATVEGCSSAACSGLTASNVSFQAFANVSQGAFLSQMTDRMYFEYQGSKAGKTLGKSTNIKVEGSSGGEGAATDGSATQGTPLLDKDGKPILDKDGNQIMSGGTGEPMLDKDGKPILDKDGKPVLSHVAPSVPAIDKDGRKVVNKDGQPIMTGGTGAPVLDKNGNQVLDKDGKPILSHVKDKPATDKDGKSTTGKNSSTEKPKG